MKGRHLDGKGKGEYSYDYKNDIMIFRIRNRDYLKSIDFDNFIADVDKEGFITGMRIFDASQIFKLRKLVLKNVRYFEFNSKVEENVVTLQMRFQSFLRNKPVINQGHDFVREAVDSKLENKEAVATIG